MRLQVGEEGVGGAAGHRFVVDQGQHFVVEEEAEVVHVGGADAHQGAVRHELFGVEHVLLPFEDAHAGVRELAVHGFAHPFLDRDVVDGRHDPADVHAAPCGFLEGLQGGGRRRGVGVVEPEIAPRVLHRPFEAVAYGQDLVGGRLGHDLDGYVRKLFQLRNPVRRRRFCQVRSHVNGLQPRRHAPLVLHVDSREVRHGGAGDADVGVAPFQEILVLEVAAAEVARAPVQEQDLAVVAVGGHRGPDRVEEQHRQAEKVQLHAVAAQGGELPQVLAGVGAFVQDDADVQALAGFLPEDPFDQGAEGVGAEAVVVQIDGGPGALEVFLEHVPAELPVGKQRHGVALRGLHAGVLLHQGGELAVVRVDARPGGRVRDLRDVGRVQRRPVAAGGEQQEAAEKENGAPGCHGLAR